MADNTFTEKDDDELIPVETQPEGDDTNAADDADGEEDDGEDSRLAQSDDDHEEEITEGRTRDQIRRKKRREIQKRARDAAQIELQQLRDLVASLSQRVAVTETHAAQSNVNTLEQRLAAAQREVEQAEHFIAKATEAGNGDDVVAAMRIRDQAIAAANQLAAARYQYEQARQQAPQQVDPNVANYAKQWMDANPWFDVNGRDRDSAVARAIDAELTREGFDPKQRGYWEELTSRISDAISGGAEAAPAKPRKKGPPTGSTREHAPVSTKKEIYVTPERKQAMIEAGVWDDPVKRQSMLRAYQAYDNSSAR